MRFFSSNIARTALIAGAALAVSACGGGEKAANNSANEIDANAAMVEPANDMSAMEAASNATETTPAPTDNTGDSGAGDTSGGDTGGNSLESNVSGM